MVYWADLIYKSHQHQNLALDFDDLHNEQVYVPDLRDLEDSTFDLT